MATPDRIVRLLINDVDEDNQTFEDTEVATFLDLEGGNVKLAAAQALDTIAVNEALVSKRIRTLNLSTDGPAVAKECRDRARELRRQVDDDGAFAFADTYPRPERTEYPEAG